MGQVYSICNYTWTYYRGFFHYWCGGGRHSPYLLGSDCSFAPLRADEATDSAETLLFKQHARIHLYALTCNFYLYSKPHYRKGSYRDDLVDNLRNVAIPGTGLPLSIIARSRWLALPFLMTGYPAISLVASAHKSWKEGCNWAKEYATRLLAPDDWFTYWRLNCIIVGLHSALNAKETKADYDMENKWTFLEEGAKIGAPISPFLNTPAIVVKHRNEEGGMGIHFFKNATVGGDWIIQERIDNSAWVQSLLPPRAPLSTFRVITCSRACLENSSVDRSSGPPAGMVTALSCVFRAGREGAATDHDSILFNVDVKTGIIGKGTTNAHWYRLGLSQTLPGQCPWRSHHQTTHHPDAGGTIEVTGNTVPDIEGMLALVEKSHWDLCPHVPFAGWDVVLSADPKVPVCLLEVNLSCNFFRGSFDKKVYFDFIDSALTKLQQQRMEADASGKHF